MNTKKDLKQEEKGCETVSQNFQIKQPEISTVDAKRTSKLRTFLYKGRTADAGIVKFLGRPFSIYALLELTTAFFLQESEKRIFGIT